jgi:predicted RNA-binding protein with EMAP domain
MGVFNVIKLANDYVQAKRYLKKNKVDAKKVKEYIDKLHDFIDVLNNYKDWITSHILKTKEVISILNKRLKERKAGK